MPVDPNATIEITAFDWAPDFAKGLVRDLRVRWALEEIGLSYRERLLDARKSRPGDYFSEQSFGQAPAFREGAIQMFESGAIVLHPAERSEALLPQEPAGRARATCWLFAALNSVEPPLMELANVDLFSKGEEWARLRRPSLLKEIEARLTRVSDALGDGAHLDGRFTAADIILTTVLRASGTPTSSPALPTSRPMSRAARRARPSSARSRRSLRPLGRASVRSRSDRPSQPKETKMAYVEGFVCAVPAANKDAYLALASKSAPLFKEFGATRMVEAWGDEVPDGAVTDFKGAVKAKDDEVVVFSWIEYPDKATRDQANEKISSDPRMKDMAEAMPFDGERMIYAGFAPLLDEGPGGAMGYADGMLAPVPTDGRDAYRDFSKKAAEVFLDHGAIRVVDAWGDDVPNGKVTDYKGAVKAKDDETVAYSWIEWPSREAHDAGWAKVMADPRMQPGQPMPFDGKRMVYGAFTPILDA